MLNSMRAAAPTGPAPQDCTQSLDMTLRWFGSAQNAATIRSFHWVGRETSGSESGRSTFRVEYDRVMPSSTYILLQMPSGQTTKAVITSDFNYLTSGKMITAIPSATLTELQSTAKLDPLYVYQHRSSYTCIALAPEQIAGVTSPTLEIKGESVSGTWNIDPATGRLLRMAIQRAESGELLTDFSDWRQVNGFYFSFSRHSTSGRTTNDITLDNLDVNSVDEAALFQAPAGQLDAGITLKVLQSESVPYVVQTGGGISTACNISGSTSTIGNASSYGNSTFGTANSNTNMQMNCASHDNTVRWTHVLNAMFVEASDGNAYIIACDRAWAWSKCKPLRSGDTFLARRSDKGFVVQSLNTKSKEQEATYTILQSKSLKQ